nr:Chain C, PA polymerase subunit [Influenza A virus H3N2]4F7M_F Chain F, PA polymerase subunit [Influenza A virus H3N2]
LYASPQLEGF